MLKKLTFTSLLLSSGLALAIPQGGEKLSGRGDLSNPSNIEQYSHHLDTSWQSFDIGAREEVNIRQPSAASTIMIRVRNGAGTQIDGRLTANGNVALVNPAGIEFGAGSVVNVGGLLASASGGTASGGGEVKAFGSITANVGDIHLQSVSANAGSVFVGGAVEATSLQVKDGAIILEASDRVGVASRATLSAGKILVGGDYQGKGSIANAQVTIIEKGAHLNGGDGGRVIVWSDGYTYFNGSIHVPNGFAEISGKSRLKTGRGFLLNVVAETLLLDPNAIVIRTANASADFEEDQAVTGDINLTGEAATDYIIDPADIRNYSNGNLIISANDTIKVNSPIMIGGTVSGSTTPAFNLTLNAGKQITISATITILNADFIVRTPNAIVISNAINTGTGSIDLRSTNNAITIQASGSLTSGDLTLQSARSASLSIVSTITSSGNVILRNVAGTSEPATGNVVISNSITITTGGTLEITAGGDITTAATSSKKVVIEALGSITWTQGALTNGSFLSNANATIMVDDTINFTYTDAAADAAFSIATLINSISVDGGTEELSGFDGVQALTNFSVDVGSAALNLSALGATDAIVDLRGVNLTLETTGAITLSPLFTTILAKSLTLNVGSATANGLELDHPFAFIGIEKLEVNSFIKISNTTESGTNTLTLRVLTAPTDSNNLRLGGSLVSQSFAIETGGSFEAAPEVPADSDAGTDLVPADIVIGTTGSTADAKGRGNILLIDNLSLETTATGGSIHLNISAANILTSSNDLATEGTSFYFVTPINAGVADDDELGSFTVTTANTFAFGTNITANDIEINVANISLANSGEAESRNTSRLTARNNIRLTLGGATISASDFHDLILMATEDIIINGFFVFSKNVEITATARRINLATTAATSIHAHKVTLTASNLAEDGTTAASNMAGSHDITFMVRTGGFVINTNIKTSGFLTLFSGGSIEFEDGVATELAGATLDYRSATEGAYRDADLTLTATTDTMTIRGYIGVAGTRNVDDEGVVTTSAKLLFSAKGSTIAFSNRSAGMPSVVKGLRDAITIEVGTDFSGTDAIMAPANFQSRPGVFVFASTSDTTGTRSTAARWGNSYEATAEGATIAAPAPATSSATSSTRSANQIFFYESPIPSFSDISPIIAYPPSFHVEIDPETWKIPQIWALLAE